MALTREDFVVQSVEEYLKTRLAARGYKKDDQFVLLDSYTGGQLESPLKKSHIAAGFDFDDGGRQAELGSSLIFRVYTIEFIVFGTTATWGRNLAQAIKFSLEHDGLIPLVDIAQAAPHPDTGEVLVLDSVSAQRVPVKDPADYERYVWTVSLKVEDTYDSRMA
jgi:hypothetical protein